jgi:hypothetical protein
MLWDGGRELWEHFCYFQTVRMYLCQLIWPKFIPHPLDIIFMMSGTFWYSTNIYVISKKMGIFYTKICSWLYLNKLKWLKCSTCFCSAIISVARDPVGVAQKVMYSRFIWTHSLSFISVLIIKDGGGSRVDNQNGLWGRAIKMMSRLNIWLSEKAKGIRILDRWKGE